MTMKPFIALSAFAALTYATFGGLDAAEVCPNNATTIEEVLAGIQKDADSQDFGRVWSKVVKADNGLTLVYSVYERFPAAQQGVFSDGCLITKDLDTDPDVILLMIGRTTREKAFPPQTPL